jgi:uncharacterized damage-inducible protein DinB
MDANTIRTLYRYSEWANERLLAALEQLTPEQFIHESSGSFKSIRDTLAHIAGAEWLWFERWKGNLPAAMPSWHATADLAELRDQMRRTAKERNERLAALQDSDTEKTFRTQNLKRDITWELPLGMMLLHVINHSTYHRGQLSSLIRQAGGVSVPTDLTIFATEKK